MSLGTRLDVRTTLGTRLDARSGIGPGFDHLRIGLALSILLWHSFGTSYGLAWTRFDSDARLFWPLIQALLPMFFALSGFLVMGSALRINDLRTFITFRALRILPALTTEIALSALVVGPLLTALPLTGYFGNIQFLTYFGSLVGNVSFSLPGVFNDAPIPGVVNGALWTVGPEVLCYVIMSFAMLTAIYRSPVQLAVFTAIYALCCFVGNALAPVNVDGALPANLLILCFLLGNLVYHYRYQISFSGPMALIAFSLAMICLAIPTNVENHSFLRYLALPLLAYVTVFIGLCDLPALPFFHRGDYSYGIYIYGFPIQQAISHFLPGQRVWWVNFLLAVPLTLLFAVASWHIVERPILGLRKTVFARGEPKLPTPIPLWGRPQYMLAVLLVFYGLFVASAADLFPIMSVFE